ncbi:hypothetical protein DQ244_05465 [Blastococcus sp. TBT05-19]|uniref:hypothetical protein n=1 Tax=Blastococcus sp. TBT05-19 TaxID=2250581 RepID=UPI000DEB2704|nr:hypothetical protein [Blastococcus sp. TBT05-19]RBY94723.1 hypothetical protein DQ244_05465 [Blastococcus sp. TBT05-19]
MEQRTSRNGAIALVGGVVALLSVLGLMWIGLAQESTRGSAEGAMLLLCWAGLVAGIVLVAVAVVRSSR